MKKIILFIVLLVVSSYVSIASAKIFIKLPSNQKISKLIKNKLLTGTNSADLVGFEKSFEGGSVYCRDFIVNSIKIVKKGKPGKVIDTFDNSYVYSVIDVYFKVKGSCKLDGPAKVRNRGHRKVILGRVPFFNSTYHVAIQSYDGHSKWYIESKIWPSRKSRAEEEAYRLNYYNKYGKGLEYAPSKERYDSRYDNYTITTPRSRLESAIREHPNKTEVKKILSIIDRNPSIRKYMISQPFVKQQQLGRIILYETKGVINLKRSDQVAQEVINAKRNGTYNQYLKTKRKEKAKADKKLKKVKVRNPFKVSRFVDVSSGREGIANKACISQFGSGYRLASGIEVMNYFSHPIKSEMDILPNKYLISTSGREIGPNFGHRYTFFFKYSTAYKSKRPKKSLTRKTKMQALCINKKSLAVNTKPAVTLHIHGKSVHDHKLPKEGARHRHGNGVIGR